ncbi:MBL fold metallo-hydrolase [Deinococcus roseus]|uniref:Metallo-beta-lactamase domain-containing protein n=1 Tax=Deinococcus roseus TaxID=392414 RepID=A0ABQ2CTL9_9DEIO|nr:MBL fold metallo-hydrolase [Deinococcus roseus]GGJ19797.1 hypothetical protein GCM10008938_02430 [Deinococcus roseus]
MLRIAEDLHLLPNFPAFSINTYLMGDVLIDAATKWDAGRLTRQLQGRKPSMLALTHVHPDHQGAASHLCKQMALPLACHEADRDIMEGRKPMLPRSWIIKLQEKTWMGRPHPVARPLTAGDEIAGFKVIHAPGHTPGSVIFFREKDGVAVAGDVLSNLNPFTLQPGLHEMPDEYTVHREQSRQSIKLLASLDPAVVVFGHGRPLTDRQALKRFAGGF